MKVPDSGDIEVVAAAIGPIWRDGRFTMVKIDRPDAPLGPVQEMFEVVGAQNDQQPALLVIDIRSITSSDALSREHATTAEVAAVVRAMCLVVDSPVTRVIGSFFIRLNRPPFPVKVVEDVEAARAWLSDQALSDG